MTKPKVKTVNDLSRCLDPLDMDATVIAVIEMSQSSWLVAGIVPGVERQPLKKLAIDEHAFCLAHLIRDAQYAIDHGDTIFAPQFKAFLKDACAVGRRRPDLVDRTIATHRRRLDRELDRLLDLKPTDVEGSHLRATIAVTARDKLLVFLTRRDSRGDQQRERAGAAALGNLPQSDEWVPLGMGRQGLRRPLLHCRHRPPRRPHRTGRHQRRSRSPRPQANRRPIRLIRVSNYQSPST